jgi:hypothetical protein
MFDPQSGGSPILQKPRAMPGLLTIKKNSNFSKLNGVFLIVKSRLSRRLFAFL